MSGRYLTQTRVERLEAGLAERDRAILTTLQQVRLASGAQLDRLHFAGSNPRHRRRVLASLVARRLLARLPRQVGGVRSGSAGFLYVLDVAGQRLVQPDPGARRRVQPPWVPGWPFIAHALAVTELYVELVEARRVRRIELFHFAGEPDCWRTFYASGGARARLKPDAYVRVVQGEFEEHWFVEVDRGTQALTTIERKLSTYRAYWASGREQARAGVFPWVLFVVRGEPRKQQLADLFGQQPADSQVLFRVVTADEAVDVMAGALP